jgi:hypothetical protein
MGACCSLGLIPDQTLSLVLEKALPWTSIPPLEKTEVERVNELVAGRKNNDLRLNHCTVEFQCAQAKEKE